MNMPRERHDAFDAWKSSVQRFWRQPFPTEWARVVNGIGLASLALRAEHTFGDLAGHWNPEYVRGSGLAQSTAERLRTILEDLERATPALPPEPRAYFDQLRALVADAIALTERWWLAKADTGDVSGVCPECGKDRLRR